MGWPCAICQQPFTKRDYPVVDHCHITGVIRGVLHNSCNGAEGSCIVAATRGHKGVQQETFIIELARYLAYHAEPRSTMIHPKHRMPNERKGVRRKNQNWRYRRGK